MELSDIHPLKKERGLGDWNSQEEDKAVTAIIQYILQITEKHFVQARRELHLDKAPTSYWFLFGVRLSQALIPHTNILDDAHERSFLRNIFAEIFDFLMYAYEGSPARELAYLYQSFGSGVHCGPILPLLLPERAQPVLEEVDRLLDADHEEDLRRQDQMGY